MMGRKYLLTKASPQVESYLGFGGRIEKKGTKFYIVSSPEEHVGWQAERLMSGWLCNGETFLSQEAAAKNARWLGETVL